MESQPPQNPPPSPAPASPPPEKKGLPPIAWVGIGCGGLLAVLLIALFFAFGWAKRMWNEVSEEFAKNPEQAAAEMAVRIHPDLEKVSTDEGAGTITVRDKTSGEQTTFTFAELKEGKFSIEGSDGSVIEFGGGDLSNVPAWVPRYPGAAAETSVFHQESGGEVAGMMSFTTTDGADEILGYYEQEIETPGGATVTQSSTTTFNGVTRATRSFKGGGRSLTVTASGEDTFTAQVLYEEE